MTEPLGLSPTQFVGIPLAVVGAALLAVGTQYQSRGLHKVERIVGESAGTGLSLSHLWNLAKRPSWLSGTVMLGLAVVFQLSSLAFSPIMIVQPIGVIGLIITSVMNARISGLKLGREVRTSLTLAVVGIAVFVSVAAFTAVDREVTDVKLRVVLIVFAVVLVVVLVLFSALRKYRIALLSIVSAGVLYGFVATCAKTVMGRVRFEGWSVLFGPDVDWLTWLCLVELVTATLVGMVFVQQAHSSGPPDLVVAGLTVIDPMVAVLIGILVLGEAAGAPWWAGVVWAVSGAVAVAGVVGLAKFHPQAGRDELGAGA